MVSSSSTCANSSVIATNVSGFITSGQHGHDHNVWFYANNMACQWNITSNANMARLELAFLHFRTESSADYVNVYDGGSSASPLIGTFSGSSLPAPIMSSSNKLHVTFTTDGSETRTGFTATYRGRKHFSDINNSS